MSIKLQQLRHFVMVVEEGGFRAASNRANRSQAALSTSIKELEKNLGQALFESGNKSKLTPFGEICLPKVIQFLNVYSALDNDLRAAAAGQQGRVRIASVPSVAAKLIPSVLGAFCEQFPNVEVSLIDDNAAGVEARLLSGEVDLALGNSSHLEDGAIEFTPLISDPIGVVCLKDNPIASQNEGIEWQTLLQQPFIRNGTCKLLDPTPARALSEQALYSVENITSLFSVLELGIGITTLPKLAFPTNETRLVWLPLIDPPLQRQIGIFRLTERTISPQAQAFHDLCVTYLNYDE
ncbi:MULTISPECIES: LysR family transcriptional regulator [Vibrio]|jgi:DNA-binding transcriptional LysR family regulator|uniref:LysR family transcriptional regulator n=1 Tax=Vibrio mediterranei TaxID=689 RepID=A0A2S9ZU97_9VIBR|nr:MULTISPECIES: LysR family transcriptional regulator [Vibrio]AYV22543.1 LysR family transcriptional regulator [Vibrio mediterranei]MCF4173204.1 LysR substrate-binding domain-containing protein [Vibrio sp. McD22-P3]MCY9854114.1 LysR substrate-binding domain-containing protein [Vibrio mediterranei]MCY9874206.1 LysR substrate-binding domain-containing protein [Vibrio barjaei]NOI24165.1 LysR family transcriptional regulator [Vibrio mediterranei]